MNKNIFCILAVLVILIILTGCYRELGGPENTINPKTNINGQHQVGSQEPPKLELDSCKEDINYNTENKDQCASLIAIANDDLEACKDIKEGKPKDRCYSEIALKRYNSSICANVVAGSEKEYCEFAIGFDSEGKVVCEKVKAVWGHLSSNECYMKVAALTKDKSYCDKLEYGKFVLTSEDLGPSKEEQVNACYLEMTKFNKEKSFCENINDEMLKKSCYEDVNKIIFIDPACKNIQELDKSICYADPCRYIKDEAKKKECSLAYPKSEPIPETESPLAYQKP